MANPSHFLPQIHRNKYTRNPPHAPRTAPAQDTGQTYPVACADAFTPLTHHPVRQRVSNGQSEAAGERPPTQQPTSTYPRACPALLREPPRTAAPSKESVLGPPNAAQRGRPRLRRTARVASLLRARDAADARCTTRRTC